MIGLVVLAVLVTLVAVLAWFALRAAVRGRGLYRRLQRRATQTVASAAPGPVEFVGRLEVTAPTRLGLDHGDAAAVRSRIRFTYSNGQGGKVYTKPQALDVLEVAGADLVDATGRVAVDLSEMILTAPKTERSFTPAEFAALRPDLHAECVAMEKHLTQIQLEEWVLPNGADVFVSGHAAFANRAEGAAQAASGYRGGGALVVGSSTNAGAGAVAPLLVSMSEETATIALLRRSSVRLALTAVLGVFTTVALVGGAVATWVLAH